MYLHPPRGGEEVPVLKEEDFIVIQALVKRGMFLCDIDIGMSELVSEGLAEGIGP
jgi:hypothetical protein